MFRRPRVLPVFEVSARVQQLSGGAEPSVSAAEEQIVNPGQSFLGQVTENRRKEGFSANECCRAPRPRRLRLTKSHQHRERLRANKVQGVAQVKSAGARWGVDCERLRMSFFGLDEV